MIKSHQSLRFIGAILIFLHHFAINGVGILEAGGPCGVAFFLILSGFAMSFGYSEKINRPDFGYKKFMIKRLIRLYPLHLLCLLGFIIINLLHINGKELLTLVPNVLCLQSWIAVKAFYFSGNAVSWCLSDMLFFYAVFPFLVWWKNKSSKRILAGTICLFLLLYGAVLLWLPQRLMHAILYINPIFRLLDFVIGMALYSLYDYAKKNHTFDSLTYSTKSLIEISSIFLLAVQIYYFPFISERFMYAVYFWIPVSLVIFLFALFNQSGGVISSILKAPLLVKAGGLSFSFYMIHVLVCNVLNRFILKLDPEITWYIKLPVYFTIVLAVSFIVWKYYEQPVSSYLKRKWTTAKELQVVLQ